jgi:transposase
MCRAVRACLKWVCWWPICDEVSGRGFIDEEDPDTGDLVATLAVTRRFDLDDGQWAVLEPLLPAGKRPGRPPKWARRQLTDGIRWRVRTGAPWRDVPECYGSWLAVYGLFRRWQRAGIWAQVLAGLQARADAAGLITWDVSVDSTIARAHQHAAGARRQPGLQKEPPGAEPADHGLGRSRGGWATKVHLACEQGQKPLAMVVTGGQCRGQPAVPGRTGGHRRGPAAGPAAHPPGPGPGR